MAEISDDILRKFEIAAKHYWDETSKECCVCQCQFRTGDVCLVYGDFDNPIERQFFYCVPDGYKRILAGQFPSASSLFVSDEHRFSRMKDLPEELQQYVIEGFECIEKLHLGMEEFIKKVKESMH